MLRETKAYRLKIVPLTCLSVMSGEELSDCDYIHDSNEIQIINYEKFFRKIFSNPKLKREQQELRICEDKNRFEDILRDYCTEKDDFLYTIPCSEKIYVGCKQIQTIYKIRKGNEIIPVIPGSSIKGAIRTALLSALYTNYKVEGKQIDSLLECKTNYSLEDAKTNGAQKSAMKAMRISDAYTNSEKPAIRLIKTMILPQKQKNVKSFTPICETIPGEVCGKKNPDCYYASITFEKIKEAVFSDLISPSGIVKICNEFSKRTFQEELRKDHPMARLVDSMNYNGLEQAIELIRKNIDIAEKTDNTFVIKIGRYSQVEYMTLCENIREVHTDKTKDRFGLSRTLGTNGKDFFPIGWCKCIIES